MIYRNASCQILLMTVLLIFPAFCIHAQTNTTWNGKSCAVVLTYDDGLNVHLSNAIPALDSLGLKGTFYISDYFDGLKHQLSQWRSAAANGHELGNHTVWHPCEGGRPGREFVRADYDLQSYTVGRMVNEIKTMNNLLTAIDGKRKRTFAYPCGDTKIHDTPYIHQLSTDFIAARGVRPAMLPINKIDLQEIPCHTVSGQPGEVLVDWVEQAMASHTLLVFLFHGVGGEHSLNVSLEAHHQLLAFLKAHENEIWIPTMVEAATYIKKHGK